MVGAGARLPESLRRSALRLGAVMSWVLSFAILATLFAPGTPEMSNRPLVAIVALLLFGSGLSAWFLPWDRWPRERRLVLTSVNLVLMALVLLASGGAGSPYYPILVLPVIFTAAYYQLREAVFLVVLTLLVGVISLIGGGSAHGVRIVIVLAAVIVVAGAFQRLLVLALQRESEQKAALHQQAEARRADLESTYLGTLRALTAALDAKDRYTESHGRETAALCLAVGGRLGLSDEQLRHLEYGALLHDIGKIGIPGMLLNKPGKLTAEEFAMIREHPVIGERILSGVPFLKPVLPLVRGEHERYDGTGYPDGLLGEAIPLGARIIFACDAFDAMMHDRPYRNALTREQALAELRKNAGTQFDPRVVQALIEVITEASSLLSHRVTTLASGIEAGHGAWAQHLDTIQDLGIKLSRINSVKETAQQIGEAIVRLVEYDHCRIWILDNGQLVPTYASSSSRPEFREFRARTFRVGEGIVGWIAETRQGEVIGDANRHPKRAHPTSFEESLVAVPVLFADELLGVIAVIKLGLNEYNRDHLRLLTILATQAGVSIANARMYERLEAEASTDSLTGLLNRRVMQGRTQAAVAAGTPFALLLADIDQLKRINDDYGHLTGDEALTAAARCARAEFGENAILARWGGDEYLALLPNITAAQAHERGQGFQAALRRHVLPAAPEERLAASFGVAHYPTDGKDATALLVAADRAMYAAKPSRGGESRAA